MPIPSRASTTTGASVSRVVDARSSIDGLEHRCGRPVGLPSVELDPVRQVPGSQPNRNRPVCGRGAPGADAGEPLEGGREPLQAVPFASRPRRHPLAELRHRGERTLARRAPSAARVQSGVEKAGERDDGTEKCEQQRERRAGHRPDRDRDPERGDHRHDGKRRAGGRRVEHGEGETFGLRRVGHRDSAAHERPGSERAGGIREPARGAHR